MTEQQREILMERFWEALFVLMLFGGGFFVLLLGA